MRYIWDVVIRLRPPLVAAVVSFAILSQPDQLFELYLINIDAWREVSWLTQAIILSIPTVIFAVLTGMLWWGSLHLLSLAPPLDLQARWHVVVADVLVIAIALAPAAGILIGVWSAKSRVLPVNELVEGALAASVGSYLWWMSGGVLLLALVVACATRRAHELPPQHDIFSKCASVAGIIVLLAFVLAIVWSPIWLPIALGSLTMLLIFFVAITWVLVLFSTIYRRTGFPVTVAVLVAATLFSWLGWNDNHRIKYQSGVESKTLDASFAEWFAARKDREHYADRGKPYPVYVIAAEGGGIYAGHHLASFLARMQQQCPGFAQHVFAISSVSGGSLGAAHFVAQVHQRVKNSAWKPCDASAVDGALAQKTAKYFSKDFLAPLLAATLFPDLVQRLLPFPIYSFDRARSLERAFAEAWDGDATDSKLPNPFNKTLDELWSSSGATPLLLLNTTNVNTGSRVTFSSVKLDTTPTAMHAAEALCARNPKPITLPLVNAVSLSARFPWVTPAGWLERDAAQTATCVGPGTAGGHQSKQRNRLYLADGGYFENSGLETASELVRRLRSHAAKCAKEAGRTNSNESDCGSGFALALEIRMIMVFAMDDFFLRMLGEDTELASSGSGELYSPLKTLLNTRSARTQAVHVREWLFGDDLRRRDPLSFQKIPNSPLQFGTNQLHQVMVDGSKFFLPLGWRLSSRSVATIANNPEGSAAATAAMIRKELMAE